MRWRRIDRYRSWRKMRRRARKDGLQVGEAARDGTLTDDGETERYLEEGRTTIRNDAGMRIKYFEHEGEQEADPHQRELKEQEKVRDQAQEAAKKAVPRIRAAQRSLDDYIKTHGKHRGLSTLPYVLFLAVFATVEYPTVTAFLNTVAGIDQPWRTIFGIALAGMVAAVAHIVSHGAHRLIQDRRHPERDQTDIWPRAILLGLVVIGVIVFTVVFSQLRGGAFAEASRLSGGVFKNPGTTNTLFLVIQLLLFGVALVVGHDHARGADRRELESEVRTAQALHDQHLKQANEAEKQIARASEAIANIERRTRHRVEQEEHHRESCISLLNDAHKDARFGQPALFRRLTRWVGG